MSYVHFIIPTVGRESLKRTIQSLVMQCDSDWTAHVIGDGIEEPPAELLPEYDGQIAWTSCEKKGSAGLVRNVGLNHVPHLTRDFEFAEWIGFVDDDDTLSPCYVEYLREEAEDHPTADVIVFRMMDPQLGILPTYEDPKIELGQVGISFAVRSAWITTGAKQRFAAEHELELEVNGKKHANEDIKFLKDLEARGAEFHLSKRIAYLVGRK